MSLLNTYWWVAVALDWSSTVSAHDWRVEENPFMRNIWMNYGDLGFTLVTVFFLLLLSFTIHFSEKYKLQALLYLGLIPVITFKILIALTNLAVIPYWITGWWQY